jgi:outer membrane protein OmpA-like peptidoglycan-associated protein
MAIFSAPVRHAGSCGQGDVASNLPTDPLGKFGDSTLTAQGQSRLDALTEDAKSRDFESVSRVGDTDPIGSAAAKATLSLKTGRLKSSSRD